MHAEPINLIASAANGVRFGRAIRDQFLLDPEIAFLNHGSFGAVPRVVFAAQDTWRLRIERQPVTALIRELPGALRAVADEFGAFVGARGADVVFLDNVTAALNAVLRSLRLAPGDEILHTNHGYGAVNKAIRFVCAQSGATAVEARVPFPLKDSRQVVEAFAGSLSPRTRLAVLDHITSPTALVLPLAETIALCRERRVPVLVDGAHAAGQIPLNIAALGADYYTGNCHKWLFAAKGTGFLWVAPQRQADVHPLIVSWGHGESFARAFDWPGTRDFSAWLALTESIAFHRRLGGEALMRRNGELAASAADLLYQAWGVAPAAPAGMRAAMVTLPLPTSQPGTRALAERVHDRLIDEYGVEVPVSDFGGGLWVRISAQCYNELSDYERLADAILRIMRDERMAAP